jgi:hypothetical protein
MYDPPIPPNPIRNRNLNVIESERERSWHVLQCQRALERRAVEMYEERAATANAANGAPGMRDHTGGEIGPLTQGPRSPRAKISVTPILPNSFISEEHQETALRERRLHPPRNYFSEGNVRPMSASAASRHLLA